MNIDRVLDPLHRVDRFLRFELVGTLNQPSLEPQRDWRTVTEALTDLRRQRVHLIDAEWDLISIAFANLQDDLNALANLLRRLALIKNTADFDGRQALDEVNRAIHRAQSRFQSKLADFERLLQQRLSTAEVSTSATETQATKDGDTLTDRVTRRLKNIPAIAIAAVIVAVAIALSTFTDALDKIRKFADDLTQPAPVALAASQAAEEAHFRIRQVDRVLANAAQAQEAVLQELKSGGVVGSRIRDYLYRSQLVTTVMEVGGVYRPPGKAEDIVWIGSSGYALRQLPDQRSYKASAYADADFRDLAAVQLASSGGKARTSAEFQELDSLLEKLRADAQFAPVDVVNDWFNREQARGPYQDRYGVAYKVDEIRVDDYRAQLSAVEQWLSRIRADWQQLKKLKATARWVS